MEEETISEEVKSNSTRVDNIVDRWNKGLDVATVGVLSSLGTIALLATIAHLSDGESVAALGSGIRTVLELGTAGFIAKTKLIDR